MAKTNKEYIKIEYDERSRSYAIKKVATYLKTITIPETYNDGVHGVKPVTIIRDRVFRFCCADSIILPNTIKQIGSFAFADSKISSIKLSNNITKLPNFIFDNCSRLTTLHIPDSIEEIEDYAFKNCKNLQEVVIPISVTKIANSAFENVPEKALKDYKKWQSLKAMRDFCLE